jgi:hypothetical protein
MLPEGQLVACFHDALTEWSVRPNRPPDARETRVYVAYAIAVAQETATDAAEDQGSQPLRRFLRGVAGLPSIDEGRQRELQHLWRSLASRLNLAGDLGSGVPRRSESARVVVELRDSVESAPGRPCWTRRAWLCNGSSYESLDDHLPDRIETPASISDYLSAIRERLERRRIAPGAIVFEIFLQSRSLSQAVDQWPLLADEGIPSELGYEHAVVIRAADRKQSRTKLEARWGRLSSAPALDCQRAVTWKSRGGNPAALYREFDQAADLQCLLLETSVGVGSDPVEFPCIQAAIAAGLPAILWARDDVAVHALSEHLTRWAGQPPRTLPELVFALRRSCPPADQDPGHLGRHLTLFFEDGSRGLPENLLAAEART